MSQAVDSKVVELSFDNRQFEQGVNTSLGTLDKLKQGLKLDGAAKGIDDINAKAKGFNLGGLGSAAETVQMKFSAMEVVAMTALSNITNSAVNAGKQLINSFTVQPVKDGFSEYELKMDSVQTIMASTGASVETVNGYLNELNTYSDKTIYSFKDMTASIGKFTNAGVDLDTAVSAIQGISNEAARSGANANEASRAMYNFSQALSTGSVKLIDWKSIENANMATVEFKQQLIDTAVALGTLTKEGDDYVSTTTNIQGKVSSAFNATKDFNGSLNYQWMTSEVLTQTLANYSKNVEEMNENEKQIYHDQLMGIYQNEEKVKQIMELGVQSSKAATEVKTFTMMMDALKEAAGSGWAQTFEILFGNIEEAKDMWTGLNNVLSGVIGGMSDARNNLLQGWKDLGGRTDILNGISNAYKGLLTVVNPIKEAFRDIFPPMTAESLKKFSENFVKFTERMKLGKTEAGNLKDTFKGVFTIIGAVAKVLGLATKLIFPLQTVLGKVISVILSITGAIGRVISGTVEWIKQSGILQTTFNKLMSVITPIFNTIKELGGQAFESISKFFSEHISAPDFSGFNSIGDVFKYIWDSAKGLIENLPSIDELGDRVKSAFDKIFKAVPENSKLGNALGSVSDLYDKFLGNAAELKDKAKESTKGLGDGILEGLAKIDFNKALKGAKVGVLLYFVMQVAGLFRNLKKASGDVSKFVKNISNIPKGINKSLNNLAGALKTYQNDLRANILLKVAAAIGILTLSIIALTFVDSQKLANVAVDLALIIGMVAILAAVIGNIINKKAGGEKDSNPLVDMLDGFLSGLQNIIKKALSIVSKATAIALIAVAVGIIASVVAKLAGLEMDANKALQVTALMIGIGAFLYILVKKLNDCTKNLDAGTGVAIYAMAAAISKLASVAVLFSGMGMAEIGKGLLGVGALIGMFAILAKALNQSNIGKAASGIAVITVALILLVPVVLLLGQLSEVAMAGAVTIAFLGAAMAGIAALAGLVGDKFGAKALVGAAAMIVLAGAMGLLAPVLLLLGKTAETAMKGIVIIAAGLLTFVGVAALAGMVMPGMLLLCGALLSFGAACLMAGAGMVLLSHGLAGLLAVVGVVIAAVTAIFLGIGDLVSRLPELADKIITGIGNIFSFIGQAIVTYAPVILDKILQLIGQLPGWLISQLPNIIAGIVSLFIQIMAAIGNLMLALPAFIGGLLQGIVQGVVQGVQSAAGPIGNALKGILMGFINLIVDGLSGLISKIPGTEWITEKLEGWRSGMAEKLKPEESKKIGQNYAKGLTDGVKSGEKKFTGTVGKFGKTAEKTGKDMAKDGETYGKEFMHQTAKGVKDNSAEATGAVDDVLAQINDAAGSGEMNLDLGAMFEQNVAGADFSNVQSMITDNLGGALQNGVADIDLSASGVDLGAGLTEGTGEGITSNLGAATEPINNMGDMLPEQLRGLWQINSPSKVFADIGSGIPEGTAQGIQKTTPKVKTTMTKMAMDSLKAIQTVIPQFSRAGVTMGNGLAAGLRSASGAVRSAASGLASAARNGVSGVSMHSTGQNMGEGFVRGLDSKLSAIRAAGRRAAEAYKKEAEKYGKIKSPSRVMMKVGGYMGEGFIIGLRNKIKGIGEAGKESAKMAIESTKDGLQRAGAILNGDLDLDPTIKPVLDLTDIENGAGMINSLLPNGSIGLGLAVAGNAPGATYRMTNEDVVSAINGLRDDLINNPQTVNNYSMGNVSYDDGSNVATAVRSLIRAARTERRV